MLSWYALNNFNVLLACSQYVCIGGCAEPVPRCLPAPMLTLHPQVAAPLAHGEVPLCLPKQLVTAARSRQEATCLVQMPGSFCVDGAAGAIGRFVPGPPSSAQPAAATGATAGSVRAPCTGGGLCMDINGHVYDLTALPLAGSALVVKITSGKGAGCMLAS